MKLYQRILAYLGIILLCIIVVLGMVLLVFRSARVQTATASVVAEQMGRALGAHVEVGKLDYQFPNNLFISKVLIEDQQTDTLLYLDSLTAQADIIKLLREDTLCIRKVNLIGAYANIYVTPDSVMNYQFLVDAFRTNQKKEQKPLGINLQIKDININEIYLNYCDWSTYMPTAALHLNDISAHNLDAEIEGMTLYLERNGASLDIETLEARVMVNDTLLSFPKLHIELPKSDLRVEHLSINQADARHLAEAQLADSATLAHAWAKTSVSLLIDNASLTPSDLAAIVPALKTMNSPWNLSAKLEGRIDSLEAEQLHLQYNGRELLSGNVTALNLPQMDSLYLRAKVEDLTVNKAIMQDIISGALGHPTNLPEMLGRLGQVHYKGSLEGRLNNLILKGAFTSALGSIRTDGQAVAASDFSNITYKGLLSTRRFDLGRMLNQKDMGCIAMNIFVDGESGIEHPFDGHIRANIDLFTYKNYTYRDICINGTFANRIFNGEVESHDENICFRFNGKADLKKQYPIYDFALRLEHLRLGRLNLSEKFADSDLALHMHVNMHGAKIDDIFGHIGFDSIRFNHKDKKLFVRQLDIRSEKGHGDTSALGTIEPERTLRITSDYINANISGAYTYSTLPTSIMRCVAHYLPKTFSTAKEQELRNTTPCNELEFYLYAKNLNEISDVLELPVSLCDMSIIKGDFSDKEQTINIQTLIPNLYASDQHIEDITLNLNNQNDQLNMSAFALKHSNNNPSGKHIGDMRFYVSAHAKNDSLGSFLEWTNPDSIHNQGRVFLTTSINRYNNQPLITTHIHPSQFLLADSTWNIYDSRIIYSAADTAIQIDEFHIASAHQWIYANGVVSKKEEDSIYVELKHVNLDYLLGALTNVHKSIYFGGTVTGWATGYGLLKTPMLEANLEMLHGHINGKELGDVYARAMFDREKKHMMIQGDVVDTRLPYTPSGIDQLPAKAVFSEDTLSGSFLSSIPLTKRLSGKHTAHLDGEVSNNGQWGLKIYPDSADIAFVNYWVDGIMTDLDGHGSGFVYVRGGKTDDKPYTTVTLRCKAYEGGFTLPYTGARYFLNDSIIMDSTAIFFNHLKLHDEENNLVIFNGSLHHNGKFQDINFDLTAEPHQALVLDLPDDGNNSYSGRVHANGIATIRGTDADVKIYANATTTDNSHFTLSLANASSAANNSFIEFVDHQSPVDNAPTKQRPTSTKISLSLQIGVTPQALGKVLLDKRTGDCLTGRGEGDLRFTYSEPDGNIQMLGTYVLQQGTFGFTFQNVIRREFQIGENSSVTWTGDAENPDVNVKAIYRLTASLKDLFGSDISSVTNRNSVPVNCVLSLSDKLSNPIIRFGIELPSSDESVASQVRSVINTDEMLMRQVLYLLVFNRFYTPEYLQGGASTGINETYSLISSTVTGQINSWLGKLTDKFSVGFNFRNDGEGADASQEYEAEFEIQPVKGLLINGNFGYRYNDISNQPLFGNLDVEYMLTPNGKLRAKAYTHTVDKYSLRSANTVQGVGFVFKHDFNWPSAEKKDKTTQPHNVETAPADTLQLITD